MKSFLRKLFSFHKKPIALIDQSRWASTTRDYAFMRGLSVEENRRLRLIASDFLSRKDILGAQGLLITEEMKIAIAAQASILVLELGVKAYDDWSDIIVYPSQFMPKREVTDELGLVHTTQDTLAGEAWQGGPVVLSYEDVARTGTPAAVAGFNVVIHEFAHKLDMQNGNANGFPPLHKGMSEVVWQQTFQAAYLQFCKAVDAAEARVAHDGGTALNVLVIDPYASENPAEFFAVISEAFFELPQVVNENFPAVYEQLKLFYRQDTVRRVW